MPCPICDQKPMNCDCTEAERRMYAEIEELQEQVPRWIPVSERLPEGEQRVLVWSQSNGLHLAYIDPWGQWRDADENPGKKITHWMPLPEPPEVK